MGNYINETPDGTVLKPRGKANDLIKSGAQFLISPPATFEDIPEGKALICVFHSRFFDAALVVYNEREMAAATDPTDCRPKTYLLMDKATAFGLSGIKT